MNNLQCNEIDIAQVMVDGVQEILHLIVIMIGSEKTSLIMHEFIIE